MGTSETDAVVAYSGTEEEEEYYEQEHLPPLLEDEENVSLADILSLRDSCLCEEEVWAVCVECVLALQSIGPSSLFHTLCITPDTLAFNAHGNVCFMEQLSDDPEGSFIPPEFDQTGCTFEGHVYSLGSTLSAALDFVIEPELEAELGEETQTLLERMQGERPEDRPSPQDILSLAESKLAHASSAAVCRKLSSIGRRVLSIESVSAFQDGSEISWEARWQQPKSSRHLNRTSLDDGTQKADPHPPAEKPEANGFSRRSICGAWDVSLWTEGMGEGDGEGEAQEEDMFGAQSDCRSQNSSPVRRRPQDRSGRVRGALNRSCSVPDSNNPPFLPPTPHGDISIPVCDLTEIGAEGHMMSHRSVWSNRPHRGEQGKSSSDCPELCVISVGDSGPLEVTPDQPSCRGASDSDASHSGAQDRTSSCSSQDPEASLDSTSDETSAHNHLYTPNNHMTKSMLCLNEESQDEWISLRELLTQCGRRLSVNELWALCHTCLSTLQTYIDYPAFLCLDTVYVGCEGDVLFLKPRNMGSCDAFFLAPEFQKHGIVTEKACVYGVAAILWATAKFNLTANQKLAMPRKLKRLLLEMAKRTPIERPSIIMAKKTCRDYLFRQGTSAESVWKKLISRVHQPHSRPVDADDHDGLCNERSSSEEPTYIKSGFVPMATESRLAPVPGPLPHSYPISRSLQLPEAFTSSATHFTPIILTQDRDMAEESPPHASDIQGSVDEFTRGNHSQHAHDKDLDTTPHRQAPPLNQKDGYQQPNRQADTLANQRATPKSSSTSSSDNTLVSSPSLTASELSNQKAAIPPLQHSSCSHLTGCGVFNDFLLRQDPQTGYLTLVPVHISAPHTIPESANLPLPSHSPQGQYNLPGELEGDFVGLRMTSSDQPTLCQESEHPQPDTDSKPNTYSPLSDPIEPLSESSSGDTCSRTEGESLSSPQIHPALKEVIALLRGEFAFDGYLENGDEDLAMGEYIFSLKDLQYHTFARVVKEMFRDLYWEEDLLGLLYCLVNCNSSSLVTNEQPPSKPRQRAALSPLRARTVESEPLPLPPLDLNANVNLSDPGRPEVWERANSEQEAGLRDAQTEPVYRDTEGRTVHTGKGFQQLKPVECLHNGCQGLGVKTAEDSAAGAMESGDHPVGGDDESPSEASSPWGREELPRGGHQGQNSTDCSEDMEDTDSLVSERLLSPSSGAEEQPVTPSPSWALAFHGEDCFSQEVINYSLNLGQHAESPCLEQKTQELQQQLIIETRNLKKTRSFYQRLLHQERKNKGSETKLMLLKLKGQLEELKTKVEFLDSVKKYLEVLSIDRWGVEASLLPSLTARGSGSLELQASEDSTVLSFGTGRGKTTLQAGSPFGLMAYLYARNAPLEGYIQQFLYTYRYFCTPEELLQFLMDNFSRATGSDSDLKGDSAKVYHRSLDLMEAWLTDCRLVDFSPESSLHNTLENFLTSKVSPVDRRGETLLATLLHSPKKRWSQGSSSPISMQEEEDLQSVHSLYRKNSIEDPGKKGFQWRFSRVVEPQASLPKEKAYSIAAALPRPCYSSLMQDVSSVYLRSEERQPFSQNEHSAQHIAQQLTMLQQEMFQGCHPVHFLNSRAQGVRDKATCKSVSHHLPPAEGSSLFVCDGPPQDGPLLQLLRYADSVTNWVSAEIVICDSVKTQAALLTKFLLTAKHCYESRDFSTAMQILGGLENVIVRQLPAWKHLSAKVCEILEELRAVQVFLKSDNLCLMGGDQGKRRPTLPSAHILAMHLQQLEIGAFTLTSGAYKWPKLRTIAKVVSQVHAFQDSVFSYSADPELQSYLRLRIAHLSTCDVHLLAADNDANFHQPHAERHTRLIQDTLRRVKATFQ